MYSKNGTELLSLFGLRLRHYIDLDCSSLQIYNKSQAIECFSSKLFPFVLFALILSLAFFRIPLDVFHEMWIINALRKEGSSENILYSGTQTYLPFSI